MIATRSLVGPFTNSSALLLRYLIPLAGSQPPSLLITVSGNVTHGGGPNANPASTHKKNIEGHPRVFSQTFMLVPDTTAPPKVGEVAKYYIVADTMRFVG